MSDDDISFIAKQVASECANSTDTLSVKNLRTAIKKADQAIENLWQSIERGETTGMITKRIEERQAERDKLAEQLAIEENNRPVFTEPQVMAFLNYIKNSPHDDMLKRRTIINIFVSAIYLYDDHYTLIFNAGGKKIRLDNLLLMI